MSTDELLVSYTDGILRLTIDRPASGNALPPALVEQLRHEITQAVHRPGVRVIALNGSGRHFCAGVDLVQANAKSEERPRVGNHERAIATGVNELVRALAEVQLPVVSAIRGVAAGVGLSLALLSDHVVADTSAKLAAPFTGRGFSPDSGTTYLLPRMIGLPRARKMLMLGETLSADQALDLGLITEVVPDNELDAAFGRAVARYAALPTVAVGIAKMLITTNLDADLTQALRAEAFAEEVSLRSQDFKEGWASFAQKRPPEFSGS